MSKETPDRHDSDIPRLGIGWKPERKLATFWLFGFLGVHRSKEDGRLRVTIALRRALISVAVVVVGGYFAGVGGLYWWLRENPYNRVTFADVVLLPVRWHQVQELRGQAYLEEGQQDLKHGHYWEGLMKVRLGLAKYPRDLWARLEVGKFYARAALLSEALEIMESGLAYGYPSRPYLKTFFDIAKASDDSGRIVKVCDGMLARPETAAHPLDRSWLIGQKGLALLTLKKYNAALALAEAGRLETSQLREIKVLALLREGRAPEAVRFLETLLPTAGDQRGQVLRLLARAYRETGELEAMSRTLDDLVQLMAVEPDAWIYSVVQRSLAGRETEARAVLARYFDRFGSHLEHIFSMASGLSTVPSSALVGDCLAEAEAQGMVLDSLYFMKARTLMHEGRPADLAQALVEFQHIREANDTRVRYFKTWLGRLLAAVTSGSPAELATLVDFFRKQYADVGLYHETITALAAAGKAKTAAQLLGFAQARFYPNSQTLYQLRLEVVARLAAQERAAQERAALAPKPVVPAALASERVFLGKLDEAIDAQRWDEAAQLVRDLHDMPPPWLAGREVAVTWRQIRIAQERYDLQELLALVKRQLGADRLQAGRVLGLAKEYHANGDRAMALALAREVAHRTPEYRAGMKFLAELEAAQEKVAPPVRNPPPTPVAAPVAVPVVPAVPAEPTMPAMLAPGMMAFASEQDFLTKLDQTIAAQQWDEAAQLVHDLREMPPSWLAAREDVVTWREIRIAQGRYDPLQVLELAKRRLNADRRQAVRVLALAKEYGSNDNPAMAIAIAREIVRKVPEYRDGVKFLNSLETAQDRSARPLEISPLEIEPVK